MRAARLAPLALVLSGWGVACADPGSWVASSPAVTVSVPGRFHQSRALVPGNAATAARGVITSVYWRHRVPAGRQVHAWLCADGHRCVPVNGASGRTEGLAGVPAGTPLHLRYALPWGERRALKVAAIQVVVNHQ